LLLGIIVGHSVLIGDDTHTLTLNVLSVRYLSKSFWLIQQTGNFKCALIRMTLLILSKKSCCRLQIFAVSDLSEEEAKYDTYTSFLLPLLYSNTSQCNDFLSIKKTMGSFLLIQVTPNKYVSMFSGGNEDPLLI